MRALHIFTYVVLILSSMSLSIPIYCSPRVFFDNAPFFLQPGDTSIVKKILTEKNGFTYQLIEERSVDTKYKHNSKFKVLSLNGDTLISSDRPIYYFYMDSPEYNMYGGFFKTGSYLTVYDMWGRKLIEEKRQITDCWLQMTSDSIPYFQVEHRKNLNGKYGFLDINGNEIIPLKYKLLKDRIIIKNNSIGFIDDKRQQPLNIFLPKHIDYSQLRNRTAQVLKFSNYLNCPITEQVQSEKDGFNWILLSQGEYTGVKDINGNVIIPLNREYKKVRYLSLGSKLGCFVFEKNNYACVSDLQGNIIMPPSRKYSIIEFEDGYGNDGSEIAGFFHAYKYISQHKHCIEICDLAGNVVIPAERMYSMVKFWAVKNHVGYFCVYTNDDKVEDRKEGVCDLSGEEIIPLENKWVTYDVDMGFGGSAIKEDIGIRLDRNGLADYQLKLQWDEEKKMAKRQKSLRRKDFLANFGQILFQGFVQIGNSFANNNLNLHNMTVSVKNTGTLASQMESPKYFDQMYQQIMALSISQVQQQEMWEYQQVRQQYLAIGKDISLIEFRTLKGQAIQDIKNQNSNNSPYNENKCESTNYSHSYDMGGYEDCHICHGSGVCQTCNGNGYVTNYGRTSECPNCWLQNMQRTGKCSFCQGNGKKFK